jgi:Na+/proline symporter
VDKKSLLIAFLTAFLIGGLFLVGVCFDTAKASTEVSGLISSNTTWTKANSPFTLTGPISINNGIKLTIEPGVTVNLGSYYIQVNGTLTAKGTSTDQIQFNGGQIIFTQVGNGWNEQTGSGCIIENAIVNSAATSKLSLKFDHNDVGQSYVDCG